MQRVLIVGAGQGGSALLETLLKTNTVQIIAIADLDLEAPGMDEAKKNGIETTTDWKEYIKDDIDIIIETTGSSAVLKELIEQKPEHAVIVPSSMAYVMSELMAEKQQLIQILKEQTYKHDRIFNATNDGMIFINMDEEVVLFNRSAAKMVGCSQKDAIGRHIREVIPNTKLPDILRSREPEFNQKQFLNQQIQIVTTRLPIIDDAGRMLGALSIFKDITDAVELAEEVTNLKEVRTMLEAIIQSSDEAISVVDEQGKGILINRAYTKMTGLTDKEVVGKPAGADISEGESMHLKVLETRRPVRGVRMKVGPNKKDVIVNVAPVIVDGILKG
ncbi:MAG: PAS domain-containing protein, partial [Bacillus sp. (in: Bacteria)]|nr:PAS domain-containing protein [Bacillus sp. (in: firmicutes)]